MAIEIAKDENQETVSRFLRALAQSIDDGDVRVRNCATTSNPVQTGQPVTITWSPEIEIVVVSDGTRQLLKTFHEGLVRGITVCHLPYQGAPFVHGWISTADGPRDVWLRDDGLWTTVEGDERNSLILSSGWELPND